MDLITLFILLLTFSLVFGLQINSVIAVNPSGFSLKIIHSDSKESPLYPGDHITPEERLQRLVQQSKDRARYIGLQVSSFNKATNSIPVSYEGVASFYVAEIGIGTFPTSPESPQPFKKNYLSVDTGSEIIWTQCAGAAESSKYFYQDEPLYPAGNSGTYEPLFYRDNHPLCYTGYFDKEGQCIYLAAYPKSISKGVLAKERFTVDSDNNGLQSFDIIMGCGFWQDGFEYLGSGYEKGTPNRVTGMLGLSSGPRSLTSQLNMSTFSYCLKLFSYAHPPTVQSSYLRFGSDATIGGGASKTRFEYPPAPGSGQYLLNLEGISVDGKRVEQVDKTTFKYNPHSGGGGFYIDSGSPFTVLHTIPFHRVADEVVKYFTKLGFDYDANFTRNPLNVCFAQPIRGRGFDYPTMTFHFEGADFLIDKKEALFSITKVDFCLGMVPSDTTNINVLGAMQQAGKRMLYNTEELSLSFIAEDC